MLGHSFRYNWIFDNIEHNLLKKEWCKILGLNELPIDQYNVFKSLTKYSYTNKTSILKHFNIDVTKIGRRWQTLLDLIDDAIVGKSFKAKLALLRQRKLITKNKPKVTDGIKTNRGIPQGSPMSALLSNIYLIEFDKELHSAASANGWLYRRYCDDLLIVCDTEKANDLCKDIMHRINKYL